MLRQPDVVAGLAGGIATVPLLALGATVLRDRAREAFATGGDAMVAAVIGAGVVAAVRGGAAPWKGFETIEAAANVVLALACACALLPPLTARFGSSRASLALAAIAGGAIVLRGGVALAVHTGLAMRDDPFRISGVALGLALVCAVTAIILAGLSRVGLRARLRVAPWLLAVCSVVAVSTAVAVACAENVLFPIELRAPAGSTFVASGSTSEALLQALTGIAHAVPRAQAAGIVVALVIGAWLAVWQTRRRTSATSAAT
jgi:hypothetical protein